MAQTIHVDVKSGLEFAEGEHTHPGGDVLWCQNRLVELEALLQALCRRQKSETPEDIAVRPGGCTRQHFLQLGYSGAFTSAGETHEHQHTALEVRAQCRYDLSSDLIC